MSRFPLLSPTAFEHRIAVSSITIQHEVEVMEVKAAFHRALIGNDKFSIREFSTWPLLNQFETPWNGHGLGGLLKPDGFIRIHERQPDSPGFLHESFLEVDRSTEAQDTLIQKAIDYLHYYASGGFAVRNGATATDKKMFPFRVLVVLKTTERRNNTAERLLKATPPILRLAWLTTLREVTTDPLGPIWVKPELYRDATSGTRFDIERTVSAGFYRRQAERDAFVESKIQKQRLLEQ